MTVPPGWYADITLRTSWTRHTRRILQSGNDALTPLRALRGPRDFGKLGEGIQHSFSFTGVLYAPETTGTQRTSPRRPSALEAASVM